MSSITFPQHETETYKCNGQFPKNIHERSPRQPRLRVRLRSLGCGANFTISWLMTTTIFRVQTRPRCHCILVVLVIAPPHMVLVIAPPHIVLVIAPPNIVLVIAPPHTHSTCNHPSPIASPPPTPAILQKTKIKMSLVHSLNNLIFHLQVLLLTSLLIPVCLLSCHLLWSSLSRMVHAYKALLWSGSGFRISFCLEKKNI